jgi:hypothetical protein
VETICVSLCVLMLSSMIQRITVSFQEDNSHCQCSFCLRPFVSLLSGFGRRLFDLKRVVFGLDSGCAVVRVGLPDVLLTNQAILLNY